MLVINVAIVAVDALIGRRDGERPRRRTRCSSSLLLSLLIALFDRFRATRDPAVDRQTVWPAVRAELDQRAVRSG